nr:4-hydroxy-tetrahydrodipicolinate synthase [Halalkalibacter hemicellulosilyticus]
MKIGKVITAMVTPFNSEGKVDYEQTKKLLDHLIANGSDAIILAGTTGESPTLTYDEKVSLFKLAVDYTQKRVPIIAGTGTNNTRASIHLTEVATKLGVDGILLVSPYYNKPSQLGIYEHFKAIAQATHLPIMLYNIPSRTGSQIDASTTISLSKIENIQAIKESSGDLELMATIIENTDDHFQVYTGDDSQALPSLAIGAKGVVSVAAHLIGKEIQNMINAYLNGNVVEAAQLHRQLLPIMKALFIAPNPVCVKYAISQLHFNVGSVRLPLASITKVEKELIDQQIRQINNG